MWRSGYDMSPEQFAAETERMWQEVKPLYMALHTYVRWKLNEKYGDKVQPKTGPIRADLLGNMWAQEWGNIYPLVAPKGAGDVGYDITDLIAKKGLSEVDMVKAGEGFFSSLGFAPLPETFWTRSQFTKPADREVVCHASAWNVDNVDDLRIKMCIEITGEDFATIHHELGHNFYQRAYNEQSFLYRDSANDGFHEAIGDTIVLSMTPKYLQSIGLVGEQQQSHEALVNAQMRMALAKVSFLPFGLMIDRWRWGVFDGSIKPTDYNKAWWELKAKYQGVAPATARGEDFFDPGAKYHVPGNTPYTRYFLAHVLQFQFYKSLCDAAGYKGPLHECSFYGNPEAGKRFQAMLAKGASQPWQKTLKELTGGEKMDASAVLEYFAPLQDWLKQQNEGRTCGWQASATASTAAPAKTATPAPAAPAKQG
jgi:peptidyl-dipeptidase A